MSNDISIKFLIHLIGERPAIWDKTSDEYGDRSLRERSWREIFTFVNENYEHMAPRSKAEFTRIVMRKWAQVRDSWVKSMKYGYDEKTMKPERPYIHHNDLKFLQKILKCKPRRCDYGISFLSNDGFSDYKTPTQNSNGELNNKENNARESREFEAVFENHDESVEIVKEGIEATEANQSPEDDKNDDEDWPVNEVDMEVNKTDNENVQKGHVLSFPVKSKRSSIFIDTCHNIVNQKETKTSTPTQFQTQLVPPVELSPPKTNLPCTSFNAEKYLNDNRHWNFFKSILPSVNSLDDDHTLQFQSGLISLLQRLRESQNRQQISKSGETHVSFRGRGRKHQTSAENEDFEWSQHTVDISESSKRSARYITDPIAAEESEYSTG